MRPAASPTTQRRIARLFGTAGSTTDKLYPVRRITESYAVSLPNTSSIHDGGDRGPCLPSLFTRSEKMEVELSAVHTGPPPIYAPNHLDVGAMNRRQRRAAAPKAPSSNELSSATDGPVSRPPSPSSSKSRAKTLYEIAAERQAELAPHGKPFPKTVNQSDESTATRLVKLTRDGNIVDTNANHGQSSPAAAAATPITSSPLPPIVDTLLLSAPLSSLHFTLSFLTFHQYAQQDLLSIPSLLKETIFIALPTLTLLIHVAHGHVLPFLKIAASPPIRSALKIAQQLILVITANVAGCYLIYLTNDQAYYAVMKRAPAIGTLWVWCVLELGLAGALAGVVGPGIFAWWNGYGVF